MAVQVFKIKTKIKDDTNLSTIFRKLLKDRAISAKQVDDGIKQYLKSQDPNLSEDEIVTHTQNIEKELGHPDMSWKVFRRTLTIVGVDEVTVLI